MAISSKGKRKITVGGRIYFWFVSEYKADWPPGVLTVMSPDKEFHAQFPLSFMESTLPDEKVYIVIIGQLFAGAETGGVWKRFTCPRFAGGTVTPTNVRRVIEWCLDEGLERQEVDSRLPGYWL